MTRLNLPNMRWSPDKKVEIYAKAIEGLLTLESNFERQIKYLDFVDIYTGLNEAERRTYESRYPQENAAMTGIAERLRTKGKQEGMQQGMQQGGQSLLRKQLERRFGSLDSGTEQRLQQAITDELERWAEQLLDASSLQDVFGEG